MMRRPHHTVIAHLVLCQLLLIMTTATAGKSPPPPERRHFMHMPYLRTTNDILNLVKTKDYSAPTSEEKERKNNNDNWMSITEDVEFLPLLNTKNNKATTRGRTLEYDASSQSTSTTTTTTGAHSYNDPFSIQPFVEGMSNYDEYQQAWRLLGFMIDCNTHVNGDDDDDGKSQHSGDEEITEEGCARYVIWAAVSSIFVWCLSLSFDSPQFLSYWVIYNSTLTLLYAIVLTQVC